MAQISDIPVQNATESAINGFLNAIKAGLGNKSGGNSLFANLLAETGGSLPKVEARATTHPQNAGSRSNSSLVDDSGFVRIKRHSEAAVHERAERRAVTEPSAHKARDHKTSEKKEVAAPEDSETQEAVRQNAEEAPSVEEQESTAVLKTEKTEALQETEAVAAKEATDEETIDPTLGDLLKQFFAALMPFVEKKSAQAETDTTEVAGEDAKQTGDDPLQALLDAQESLQSHLDDLLVTDADGATDISNGAKKKIEALNEFLSNLTEDIQALQEEGGEVLAGLGEKLKNQKLFHEPKAEIEGGVWGKDPKNLVSQLHGQTGEAQTQAGTGTYDPALYGKQHDRQAMPQPVAAVAQQLSGTGSAAKGLTTEAQPTVQGVSSTASAGTNTALAGEGVRPVGSYNFASQLSDVRATKGGNVGLPQPVEQVAVQLYKNVKDGNNEFTINLKPAELGKIEIKLDISADKTVKGTVIVDNQTTLNLLQKDSSSLQRALQEAGLSADAGCMQFSLRDDGQSSQFAQNQRGGAGREWNRSSNNTEGGAEDISGVAAAHEIYYLTPGRVNLRV
ncbi:MAG: flagellar hook-length control protein FliK [Proteobacteria bacterium]|nr:flagellar hook-length control protein FliK [Pseudomonadota bacterium]